MTAQPSSAVDIRGRRALVTGGAGAVGSHVVEALLAAGAEEVRVLDLANAEWDRNLVRAEELGRVTQIVGDVRDRPVVEGAMAGIDLVFHQAALRVTHCVEDPRLAHEVMGGGTFQVVDAAARAGVSRLVMASSAAVYGPDPQGDISETARTDGADSMYGVLKAYGEALLRSYSITHGLRGVALRYFNVYGARMNVRGPHTEVLVRWMERIERGDPPLIDGDGMQAVDFVHVTDVARANVLAAAAPSSAPVFNVGSGHALTLNDLAATLLRTMSSDLRVRHGPPRAVNSARRRVADPALAERDLGFRVRVPLDDGLRDLVAWWREPDHHARPSGDVDPRGGGPS